MTDLPPPRPALRKAADGTVHPASPLLSSLAVTLPEATDVGRPRLSAPSESGSPDKKAGKKAKRKKKRDAGAPDLVEVVVHLPRGTRKALRRRAQAHGWGAEEAAAHVLRVWAEG